MNLNYPHFNLNCWTFNASDLCILDTIENIAEILPTKYLHLKYGSLHTERTLKTMIFLPQCYAIKVIRKIVNNLSKLVFHTINYFIFVTEIIS